LENAMTDLAAPDTVAPPLVGLEARPTLHETAAPAAASVRRPRRGFAGRCLDEAETPVSWLWDGYLARGHITLLTAQWKSGKTTLLSALLSRLQAGGQLGALGVAAARPVVVSEEPRALWRPRHQRLDLGHVYFICQPFKGKPTFDEWLELLGEIDDERRENGAA